MLKTNKSRILALVICAMVFVLCLCGLTACADTESNGTYTINLAGSGRSESIVVTNADKASNQKITGKISGSIYNKEKDEVYTINKQSVTLRQYEGNLWYCKVTCTNGYSETIFAYREGTGKRYSQGYINITAGVDFIADGSIEISIPYEVSYNADYDSLNYLNYLGVDYLK